MVAKSKMIEINLNAAKQLVRILGKYEGAFCTGCEVGSQHEASCPSREANQITNYLTMRINNPNKKFNI